ncbi:hypothetical protein NC653_024648 [Populus alba x Populus x berolinensis]|uniref:Uncharacterized protein n=1 Tax=Populus alba x Populus x berolinensis TaxID=444605 RepID=A0AAD6Q8X4_9ROSI|nr:hypothetical protein NC653_024648 [Populus alba x Populus x berolinensis]
MHSQKSFYIFKLISGTCLVFLVKFATGYYCLKSKEGGGKNIKKPLSGLTLERILRSSSRYKKAKLTVSQLEDTENEPVDFVPDSQANP